MFINPLQMRVFDRVSFSHGSNRVLLDVNCLMPEGKLTALVRYSGSGKTTLVNLIARFCDQFR